MATVDVKGNEDLVISLSVVHLQRLTAWRPQQQSLIMAMGRITSSTRRPISVFIKQ